MYTFAEWRSYCGTAYSEDDVINYWNHILRIPDYQPGARFRNYGSDGSRYIQGPARERQIDRWVNQQPDETKVGSEGPITRSDFGNRHRVNGNWSFRDILLVWDFLPHDWAP